MSSSFESATLHSLRRIDEKLDNAIERQEELSRRLGSLELTVADMGVAIAGLGLRMDKLDASVARIERRLDVIEERATS